MTEYWVSQGNHWCDFCKIYISNNPASIRNHDLGTRHKEAVAKKLQHMRKDNAAKEKAEKEAERALLQIEAKAKRSYQKDMTNFQEARDTHARELDVGDNGEEKWQYDSASGYHYHQNNGFCYDANSGFYFSDAIGKWVTQEEAYASPQFFSNSGHKANLLKKPTPNSRAGSASENKCGDKAKSGPAPGPVHSASSNPMRSVKGAPSKVVVGKRKRQYEKPKVMTAEEAAALKTREAAWKRVQEREKPLLGLYRPQLFC